eukprot:CAMPEP_0175991826 /NCGR_PEP_ID=MMETSP0108-20121206/53053_1 /TAXON_ID=195067 ORGANISM="Goniomonas pacifica, Strain CCMP1869" /NCGR_SAMPLE_ID=MMETSP0108 /ASSEMBLY_ACC=CAM_ASM_000204 /LENGTH=34 /DNA_ID= /DNA_START= /DNA_END= /DNA_ORIENTATION=
MVHSAAFRLVFSLPAGPAVTLHLYADAERARRMV